MIAEGNKTNSGVLFGGRLGAQAPGGQAQACPVNSTAGFADQSSHKLAFSGLLLFTLLLYARPQELFSEALGELSIVKFVAIATLIAYAVGKLRAGERLTTWPLEMKMLLLIVALGILFVPIAFKPQRSIDLLTDTFLKVIIIFVLMVNLINTRRRLHSIMKLVVFCGVLIAVVTIKNYLTGQLDVTHISKTGAAITIGDFFDNTNELALTLDLLLPFAIAFAITRKGLARIGYSLCAAVMTIGAVITFSRGGFLGLVSMGGVFLWKLGRGRRATAVLAAMLLMAAFACIMPSGYSERIFTILRPADDKTNSAQERQRILERGIEVALHHPIIGIGMANFYEYSPNGKVAHNSYLEVASELGITGLIAYLTFLITPLRALKRIERDTLDAADAGRRELYYLSVCLQAVMIAFMVCSFFSSSQYFWHPYYIVGYSIALRTIHASEAMGGKSIDSAQPSFRTAGKLWKLSDKLRFVGSFKKQRLGINNKLKLVGLLWG